MDSAPGPVTNAQPTAPDAGTDSGTVVNSSQSPQLADQPSQDTSTEQSQPVAESHPPAPTPSTTESSESVEHAYWTEFDVDTSAPDEEEVKEIEAAENDYSAYDYGYWEKNFFGNLDDPEYQPGEKARLTWKIKGVRGTAERPNRATVMRSPAAYVGGYWWRIKFYPRGNNVGALSVYLECSQTLPTPDQQQPQTEFQVRRGPSDSALGAPDLDMQFDETDDSAAWLEKYKSQYPAAAAAAATPTGSDADLWRVSSQIGVLVYNPEEPRTGWMQSSCHQFNPHNLDWGWTYFHGPWDQIHIRRRGQHRPLLCDDTLAFDAYIRVIDDPTKSLWWHPSDSEPTWDSLALTGYRPLGDSVINHSAEVAGLASWLHIAPFCKIIQSVDVLEHLNNCDVKPKPLCDALQKLLWQLRCRSKSLQYVDTDGITSTLRNLHEYSSDVSEFWERLRRTLELELAGTDAGKQFAQLFDSPGPDTLTLQSARPVNTLPTGFNSRLRVSADQFRSTGEAVKNCLEAKPGSWSLPPILHVELNRHVLDKGMRWQLLYNKVDLDEELDLAPYVVDGQEGKYVLYGYIVHRGRRTSGKFFSILRPAGPGTRWLAFDDGSDNRVECLTRMTALGPHLGLNSSQAVDHKKGHDVAVGVMYIRSDKVSELLPGPQGPWEVSEELKQYYETGVYPSTPPSADGNVQVEVYSLPQYEQLNSLFDTYDLMSQAKAANGVMYMTLPRSSPIVDLRKKIAMWKSTDSEALRPERVRLWQIGHTRAQFGPTLAFDRITDLNAPLDPSLSTIRFWVETISEADAKLFAMPDPPTATTAEDKPDESIFERENSGTPEPSPSMADGDAEASSSGNVPNESAVAPAQVTSVPDIGDSLPPVATASPEGDASAERAEAEAALAVAAAHDRQATEAASTTSTEQTPSSSTNVAPAEPAQPESTVTPVEPEVALPVGHAYYFIQIFDADNQVLRTVGSFFSQLEANVKASIRKHLQRPIRQDFLMWKRVDGTTVTTVSPAENFLDVVVPHGACIIIGDKLSKDKRSQLGAAGMFASPDRLVQYLWAESRGHPIQGFTGTKTVEATFTADYYSGQFLKGYYHGQGKHISGTGTVYEGDFVLGRRQGQGKMEYPTGDTYDGDWVEDVRHGQGTYIEKSTGNKYVGGYKDGKRHGKGISYWEVAEDEMDLCQICYSEEQNAVFCDCGHVCACVTCAKQVDLCPICRKTIKSVIKIYRT
ncbi:Zinc finger RING-type [Penicillium riverlandense]|uniref:Zinc finger RING-type n=1 Tax=Penicillium riverlandense TaxID=1903569 RepID=UPI002546B576|nr:Zinc finger RING-type [Penicillium riverlandense]KAJ5831731.1 Zinc finger RING-type [Penicillium riverlandense]